MAPLLPSPGPKGGFASQFSEVAQSSLKHDPKYPIDYKRLETYVSAKDQLNRLATKHPHNLSPAAVQNAVVEIKTRVNAHFDPETQSFTEDEQMWLAERVFFGRVSTMPFAQFEGIRPHNPSPRFTEPGQLPPCKTCSQMNAPDQRKCPFVQTNRCHRAHGPYYTRYGAEPKLDGCPESRLVEVKEGWGRWGQY